ncbi:MAG: cysteine--tRNA ligase [Parachlamydiaceae bacterium]|nr:cysteine--tRNA ligase [Parachlamydiaceae bacterium]
MNHKRNGIELKFYNTATRSKEVFKPREENHVRMYTCGPTVYNYAHIGNFRTYVFEDLLRRTIKFFGLKITQVMNLTDVDDKTIKGAIANDCTLEEFTQPYKDAFFEDLASLNIERVEHYPAATGYIPEMITMILSLLDKGIAYESHDGSIYYAIDKFPRYGCLSHLNFDELKPCASHRNTSDEYEKENVSDFVLWKKCDPLRDGKTFWDSPFGKGRPGWHLECSAMAISLLGPSLDIHVGGIDNMFPHHENEIAQSEAFTQKTFSKLWMHSEHLLVDNKKMSKSLGNFYTLRDLLAKGYTGTQVRYMLLHTHYKTSLNFTFVGLEAAKATLQRIQDFIRRMQEIASSGESESSFSSSSGSDAVTALLKKGLHEFAEVLADDLNISSALAVLFELIRDLNGKADEEKLNSADAKNILELLQELNQVLGVFSFEKQEVEIPLYLQEALQKRIEARQNKNWAEADSLRDTISQAGYIIEDTPVGMRLKKDEIARRPA